MNRAGQPAMRAEMLPIGSIVTVTDDEHGEQICKKVYAREDGEHWIVALMWSGDPVYDRQMNQLMTKNAGRVLRVGREAAPDEEARERLARHLYEGSLGANMTSAWDRQPDYVRENWLARADQLIAVLAGKES